jgi:pimeloyl-ACP methyl ester carboxylesterase
MTAIEVKRAIIVGHSMGGAIALNLALEHPTVVAGLGLVSTGARLRVHPTIMELTAVPETFAEGIEQISAWSFGPRADPRLVELAAKRMLETPQHVFQADFAACDVFDVRERLSEIRTATLVICGSEDRMTPVRFAQSLAEHISGAALTILPEAGHMAILEQPQAILGAFKNFLSNR